MGAENGSLLWLLGRKKAVGTERGHIERPVGRTLKNTRRRHQIAIATKSTKKGTRGYGDAKTSRG